MNEYGSMDTAKFLIEDRMDELGYEWQLDETEMGSLATLCSLADEIARTHPHIQGIAVSLKGDDTILIGFKFRKGCKEDLMDELEMKLDGWGEVFYSPEWDMFMAKHPSVFKHRFYLA